MRKRVVVLATGLILVAASNAAAATVRLDRTWVPAGTLVYEAEPGETNSIDAGGAGGRFHLTDRGAQIADPDGICERIGAGEVVCPAAFLEVHAGDGADQVSALTEARVDGGPGDDRIAGNDTYQTLGGGEGRDVVTAGGGGDTLLEENSDDGDVLDGGPGLDTVKYSGSPAIDLLAPEAPGRETLRDVETVLVQGTAQFAGDEGANDVYSEGAGSRLDGRGGNDRLVAQSRERDELTGGPGDDTLWLHPFERPAIPDAISCGAGRDSVEVLASDQPVPDDCEAVSFADPRGRDRSGYRLHLPLRTPSAVFATAYAPPCAAERHRCRFTWVGRTAGGRTAVRIGATAAPGNVARGRLRLSRSSRSLLRRRGTLAVTVGLLARGGALRERVVLTLRDPGGAKT